jgi:GDP-4-dehydro-6-deoxy-D-mannose reductase
LRVLITGATGFVGTHLAHYLHTHNPSIEIHGTSITPPPKPLAYVQHHTLDLRDAAATHAVMAQVQPSHVYHLAAQAFVPRSFEDPWETLENNVRGQLNIITACLEEKPRILVISSAEVYGAAQPQDLPLREDAPLLPASPYSVSKVAQEMLGLQYYLSHQVPIIRARAFNHIGPGQNDKFVAPAFGLQIARIEAGLQEPILHVGDLSAQRDFADVRDVVRAYVLLMEHGKAGAVYNVCTGVPRSAQTLLDGLIAHSTRQVTVALDPARLRPVTLPVLVGDNTLLHTATGWQPLIPFEQSIHDILNDCRQRIGGV